jgi:hypothetical protein
LLNNFEIINVQTIRTENPLKKYTSLETILFSSQEVMFSFSRQIDKEILQEFKHQAGKNHV